MTKNFVPITIGSSIKTVEKDFADALTLSRQRFDAMTEEDDDDDEDEDEEPEMSFKERMAAAKKAKKDSADARAVVDRIDALEAENEVLAALVGQSVHQDADDEDDDEMEMLSPQEIAMIMLAEFKAAKPFLPGDSSIANFADVYDIYEAAIANRYPGSLVNPEMEGADDNDRIDPMDADELRGAFKMMLIAANPMQQTPDISLDSTDADRQFSEALGLRSDSGSVVIAEPLKLKPLY